MKNLKVFLKENINEYKIQLTPDELKHFKVAIELNKQVNKKFPTINTALVGGACRDLILRYFTQNNTKTVNDLDFAIYKNTGVGLNDKELRDVMDFINTIPDFSVVDEIKFLHLKIIHRPTSYEIEYTSLRKEMYRDLSRKPETTVGQMEDDYSRRDFTINAVFLDIKNIVGNDLYVKPSNKKSEESILDIQNKILRTTTEDPNQVFDEDSLRLLRAVRFSKDYKMDDKLKKAVDEYPSEKLLTQVSKERIADELGKILEKGDVDYLIKSGFIKKIMSEFSDFDDKEYKDAELQHIIDVIKVAREKAPKDRQLTFLLTALFHDIGKGSTGTYSSEKERWQFLGHEEESSKKAEEIMKRYKFSNPLVRDVSNLVNQHMVTKFFDKVPDKTIIKWILVYDNQQKYPDLIENALIFNTIDWGGKSPEWREKNKDMIKNEREIAKKVLYLRDEIRKIKSQYKDELSAISTEIGKDKHIPPNSKSGAILKRHANFILSKLKNS